MKKIKETIGLFLCFLMSTTITSCDPAVLAGIAQGMAGLGTGYGGYTQSYNTGYSGTAPSSYSSSSSSHTKCSRCGGTGACKTCGGSGQVYDYGSASVISKEKYTHRCGVCNGSGKCGVCNGKGYN